MSRSSLVRALAAVALSLPLGACVLPDQMAQLRKDVADVQQQLRGVQREQTEADGRLQLIESLVSSGEGVDRTELADIQLQLSEIQRNVAILDERVNDANWRIDRLSQNVQEARALARRRGEALPPPPADDEAAARETPPAGTRPAGGAAAGAIPSPEALYNAAYADFSKGNYPLAVSGFEEYYSRFPDSDLADNALYWVGECYFSQGRFGEAVDAFDRLLGRYPKSDRAPAADLKKGLAYLEENQVGKAIVQLRYVLTTYPATDESRIARDKLASLGASVR